MTLLYETQKKNRDNKVNKQAMLNIKNKTLLGGPINTNNYKETQRPDNEVVILIILYSIYYQYKYKSEFCSLNKS